MERTGSQTGRRAAMAGVGIGWARDKEHTGERRRGSKVGYDCPENARKRKWRGTGHSCLASAKPGEGYFMGLSPMRDILDYAHKVSSGEGRPLMAHAGTPSRQDVFSWTSHTTSQRLE
jgi:hypothetical protein